MKTKLTIIITILAFGLMFITTTLKTSAGIDSTLGCCNRALFDCIGCGDLDCAISRAECEIIGGEDFDSGLICFDGQTCETGLGPGCCVIEGDGCQDDTSFDACDTTLGGNAWFRAELCRDVPGCEEPIEPRNVPTLSGLALIALAGVLGFIGFMVIRRRKASA